MIQRCPYPHGCYTPSLLALSAPGTRNEILRGCGRLLTNYPDQPATHEQRKRILYGTTRQAGRGSDPAMAGAHAAALGSPRLRPQTQVNDKCRRSAVMSGEVAHEYIYYVVVKTQVRSHAHILL